jgi:hypothetical protein
VSLETDPDLFFGELGVRRKANWKLQQLCRQVERAAALALAEVDAPVGAAVAEVVPAPDATRLRVVVVLAAGSGAQDVADTRSALARGAAAFRSEVARAIHRKRVPEVAFDVRLAEEVEIG